MDEARPAPVAWKTRLEAFFNRSSSLIPIHLRKSVLVPFKIETLRHNLVLAKIGAD